MSVVTNCILSFSIIEDTEERMKEVNSFFDCNPLISCADESIRGWHGGDKYLETPIYIGAFNYFHVSDFVNHISTVDWEFPEDVQLLIQEQDDNCFTIFRIPSPHDRSKFQVTTQHISHAKAHGYSYDYHPIALAISEVYPGSLFFGYRQTLFIMKPGRFCKIPQFYYAPPKIIAYDRNWFKDAKPFDFEITGLYADRML